VSVSVRRIRAEDWPRLRALRLEALRDTPIAYLEAYDAAAELGDDEWRFRADRGTWDGRSATFVAEGRDGTWVGMAGAFVADEDRSHATVVAVYVSAAQRGRAGRGRGRADGGRRGLGARGGRRAGAAPARA